MANLRPFLDRHDFLHGLNILRRAFAAAHSQVMSEMEEAETAYWAHVAEIGDGIDTTVWTDGLVTITTTDSLRLDLSAAGAAVRELRLAFAVTFYHHWERSVSRWMGKHIQGHDKLEGAAKALGYPVHEDMQYVQCLANLTKHGTERWALKLFPFWPDLFGEGFDPEKARDWRGELDLQEDHIWQIAEIVEACAPTVG